MPADREDKNPWCKWYWQDWVSSNELRISSLAAKGLWMDMLAIMARSEKKGFLQINGKQIKSKDLAKLLGEDEAKIKQLLDELEENGVYSVDKSGVIFCRRMEREAHISYIRSEAGKLGGRPKKQIKSKKESKAKAASASASASASEYASTDKKKVSEKTPKIAFNFELKEWENITTEDKRGWKEAYPACDIDRELKHMREWLKANPDRRKSNYRKFIVSWLKRSQDSGGTDPKQKKQNRPGLTADEADRELMKNKL